MDPHTATCIKAYEELKEKFKTVIYSTAEWTKFSTVLNALKMILLNMQIKRLLKKSL